MDVCVEMKEVCICSTCNWHAWNLYLDLFRRDVLV